MKYIKYIFASAIFVLITAVFALSATGEENFAEYEDFFGSLPDGIADSLPQNATGKDPEADAKSLTAWDFLLSALGEEIKNGIRAVFPMLFALIGLILLSAVISAFKSSLELKTAELLGRVSSIAITLAFISFQFGTIKAVAGYLSDLLVLVNAATPTVAVLYATGGNVASASASAVGMSVFMGLAENLLAKTVVPFSGIYLSLSAVSSVAQDMGIERVSALLKKGYTTLITFLMSIFSAILAAQHALAASADSVSLRAAKFVAGSSIPIVGGTVGESLKTLAASISLIRKSFGISVIIMIALLTLPVLILLLFTRFAINLSATIADLLGCAEERRLLDSISGVYGCLIAVIAIGSLMFVFLLTLLVSSRAAIAG